MRCSIKWLSDRIWLTNPIKTIRVWLPIPIHDEVLPSTQSSKLCWRTSSWMGIGSHTRIVLIGLVNHIRSLSHLILQRIDRSYRTWRHWFAHNLSKASPNLLLNFYSVLVIPSSVRYPLLNFPLSNIWRATYSSIHVYFLIVQYSSNDFFSCFTLTTSLLFSD